MRATMSPRIEKVATTGIGPSACDVDLDSFAGCAAAGTASARTRMAMTACSKALRLGMKTLRCMGEML